ncbi:ABC transporter ATP-binding protein [Rhodoplanes sp. TEM]|uniref:ABC transporter ATP-binding protein n=1 Tax=Rhodoplanes tepidamans TaxID=200616 RepID=A0ABT5J415_RHOTP|nr:MULTISPECIES: ABC transporter ATP-binding protein [Rhodoplanes]MDC7784375.1 ABC transporter ATP-binding protein [Rhodoplanes tepidamans]MDC7983361.1 ABC transporter ATP-binding protein [Rhodoplanes sp. TEM]MDQ0354496.1 branched-chain amino acid transport system ATP-binding protein [Rhodoplanes tepidamans]
MIPLRVTGLTVSYGRVAAVRDLDLNIAAGEALALLGPNGAGKTSAVEAIAGLLPKRAGRVELFGEDISGLTASAIVRKGLALVPQWRELFPTFSVEETLVAATGAAQGRSPKPLEEIYALFPVLEERRGQLAGSLSGGEQQMLAIGRALVTNPRLLLLDEPSAGLAQGITRSLIQAIIRIRDSGVPILLVEQNMEIARAIGSRCTMLAAGSLAWEGTMDEAIARNEAARVYFGTH